MSECALGLLEWGGIVVVVIFLVGSLIEWMIFR
jgi:hypothetical protein